MRKIRQEEYDNWNNKWANMKFDSTEKLDAAKEELKKVTIWNGAIKSMENHFAQTFSGEELYD